MRSYFFYVSYENPRFLKELLADKLICREKDKLLSQKSGYEIAVARLTERKVVTCR